MSCQMIPPKLCGDVPSALWGCVFSRRLLNGLQEMVICTQCGKMNDAQHGNQHWPVSHSRIWPKKGAPEQPSGHPTFLILKWQNSQIECQLTHAHDILIGPMYGKMLIHYLSKTRKAVSCITANRLYSHGAPGRIRTPGRLLRRQMLYPTELQARVVYAGRWPLLPYGRLSLLYDDCRWGQAIGCIKTSENHEQGVQWRICADAGRRHGNFRQAHDRRGTGLYAYSFKGRSAKPA